MKNKIKTLIRATKHSLIKVRLDAKTIITIRDMSAMQVWIARYPGAVVIH